MLINKVQVDSTTVDIVDEIIEEYYFPIHYITDDYGLEMEEYCEFAQIVIEKYKERVL